MGDASFTRVMQHTPDLFPAADSGMGLLDLAFHCWREIFPKPPQTEELRFVLEDHPSHIRPAPVPAHLADGRHFSSRNFSGGCAQQRGHGPFGAILVPAVGNAAYNHAANQDSMGQTQYMHPVSSGEEKCNSRDPMSRYMSFPAARGCRKTISFQTPLRAGEVDGLYPAGTRGLLQGLGAQSETRSDIVLKVSKPIDKSVAHIFIFSIGFNAVILIIG